MKPENHDEGLLEQGLAAWDVPEPPLGLIDRILAQNAETLDALSTPTDLPEPPAPEPASVQPAPLQEDTPAMLPTDLRTESPMRPFWTATMLGFAAAAAIVLAFMAGRQSSTLPPVPVSPVVPNVEIQVTAPAPIAQPPVPPAPPAPPALPEKIIINETSAPVDPIARPRRVRGGRVSSDLKNPFGSQSSPQTPKPKSEQSKSLKNPFDKGQATLRLGTNAGSPPADVSVDGKPVGRTPIVSLKVSPGEHTVVFQWPSKRRSFTIDVEADESRIVRAGNE